MAVPKKKVSFRRRALKRKVKPFLLGVDHPPGVLCLGSLFTIKRHHCSRLASG